MKFQRVYKCQRCGRVTIRPEVLDEQDAPRYVDVGEEHACYSPNERGVAKQVGVNIVQEMVP